MKPAWADKEYMLPEPWHVNVHPFFGSRLVLLRRAVTMDPNSQAITYMKIVKLRASCWTIFLQSWLDNIYKQKVWNISVEFQNHLWIGIQNTLTDGWEKNKVAWDFGQFQSQFFLIFFSIVLFYSLYTSIRAPLFTLLLVRAVHIPPPPTPLPSPQIVELPLDTFFFFFFFLTAAWVVWEFPLDLLAINSNECNAIPLLEAMPAYQRWPVESS